MLCFQQLDRQDQIRVLDHRNSCEVLSILLMSAENYALGNSPQRKFGKYDKYDNVKYKSRLGLKRQLIYEIIVNAGSFKNYVNKYTDFLFPKNLSKGDIEKYVYYWKSLVNYNDQKYYDDIISIINGKEIPDRLNDLSQLPIEKSNNSNYEKIKNMIEYSKRANDYLDNEEAKATQEFEKNGHFLYIVEFGVPAGSEIRRMEEIKKKQLEKLKREAIKKQKESKEAREKYEKEKNKKGKDDLSFWW